MNAVVWYGIEGSISEKNTSASRYNIILQVQAPPLDTLKSLSKPHVWEE